MSLFRRQSSFLELVIYTFSYCSCQIKNEPPHDKTNNVVVRPAKTQISLCIHPVWSESSLSAWRKLGVLSYPLSAQRRLWSDWADYYLLVLSRGGSNQKANELKYSKHINMFLGLPRYSHTVTNNTILFWDTYESYCIPPVLTMNLLRYKSTVAVTQYIPYHTWQSLCYHR